MPLMPGERVPKIVGETQSGPIDLDDYRGTKTLVIWTYPKDDTAG
jgi:peroxiredoxin